MTTKKVKPTTWFVKKLIEMGACYEAIEHASKYRTFAAAWRACGSTGWMRWLLINLDLLDNLAASCPRYCCDPDDVVEKRIRRRFPAERVAKAMRKKESK